jgi:hypothetical protein
MTKECILLREKLHRLIDTAEDRKIEAMCVLFEDEIAGNGDIYSTEFKAELDKRYDDYKKGKVKLISAQASKNRINKIIKEKFAV